MRILVILGCPRDLDCTLLLLKKTKNIIIKKNNKNKMPNRREGNDQESIQERHQRERNTNTKYLDPNGNISSRKPKL